MDQRLLLSALPIELFVSLWPVSTLFLDPTVFGDTFVFIGKISVLLSALSLGAIVAGIWRKGQGTELARYILFFISGLTLIALLFSSWWLIGMGTWWASECGSLSLWKCTMASLSIYVELYFVPILLGSIITIAWTARSLPVPKR